MDKQPYFKDRTATKGFVIPRPQMRMLWHLAHGARVETWLAELPNARMWTEDAAQAVSTASVTALFRKKLIKKGRVIKDDKNHRRTTWLISAKGMKIVEANKYGA